jgi:isopropylmalate/homocitrate/citramalate synthase
LRDRATYEPFPSSDVGRDGSGFVVGRHSNVAMLADLCRRAGLGTDGLDFDAPLTRVRSCTGCKKMPADLELLRTLVAELRAAT